MAVRTSFRYWISSTYAKTVSFLRIVAALSFAFSADICLEWPASVAVCVCIGRADRVDNVRRRVEYWGESDRSLAINRLTVRRGLLYTASHYYTSRRGRAGCCTVVERRSLTGELSLSCARPAADGWPLRYDTRCYFNVRSKADISQLNLPHGNRQLKKCKNRKKLKSKKMDILRSSSKQSGKSI